MLQNQQQQEGSKGRLMGGQCGNLPHVGSQDRKGRESTKYEEDEGCRGRRLNGFRSIGQLDLMMPVYRQVEMSNDE
jgi:hypothetical protein